MADKEAIPNAAQLAAIRRAVEHDFALPCCDCPGYGLILPTLGLGGHGTANVSGNIIPKEMGAMSRPWQIFENVARSRELCFSYLPLLEMMYSLARPVPVKTAMGRWDPPAGRVLGPLPDIALEKV